MVRVSKKNYQQALLKEILFSRVNDRSLFGFLGKFDGYLVARFAGLNLFVVHLHRGHAIFKLLTTGDHFNLVATL